MLVNLLRSTTDKGDDLLRLRAGSTQADRSTVPPRIVGVTPFASAPQYNGLNIVFTNTGRQSGDLLVVLVENQNSSTIITPSGWTQTSSSPQSTGGVRLAVFYKVSDGTETSVSWGNGDGTHQAGAGFVVRDYNPAVLIHALAGAVLTPSTASVLFPSVTTTVDNCLIVNCVAVNIQATSSNNFTTAATNPNLIRLTELFDGSTVSNFGGGVAAFGGLMVPAGSTGQTAVTSSTSDVYGLMTLAFEPVPGASESATDGSSAGAATADGVAAAIAAAAGAADGAAAAAGGGASVASSEGAASGSASTSGAGASIASADGSAGGASTASAQGEGTAEASGSSSGSSTAAGSSSSSSVGSASGSAAGSSSAAGAGATVATAAGSAAGSSSVVGAGAARAAASGSSPSTSTAQGIAIATAAASGSAAGAATAAAAGASAQASSGLSQGASSAGAVGRAVAPVSGQASGVAAATGDGEAVTATSGEAAGQSTVEAQGITVIEAAGSAAGLSTVAGDAPIVVPVNPVPLLLLLEAPYRTRLVETKYRERILDAAYQASIAETKYRERIVEAPYRSNVIVSNRRPQR